MSPTIARPGALGSDLEVGTPEWERVRREHDEEVARGARLRQLQARLPLEIHASDVRVRDLAGRLGLDLPTGGGGLHPRVTAPPPSVNGSSGRRRDPLQGTTAIDRETLAALPGACGEVAARLGITPAATGMRLRSLSLRGLVTKPERRGGAWTVAPRREGSP